MCSAERSTESAFADITQPVTTVSAVHLSTMTSRGRLPTASWAQRMHAKVSDGARKSNAEWDRLVLKVDISHKSHASVYYISDA